MGELLAHEPDTVPFDVKLSSQLQRGDLALGLGQEPHGLKPLGQRQGRMGEDGRP